MPVMNEALNVEKFSRLNLYLPHDVYTKKFMNFEYGVYCMGTNNY